MPKVVDHAARREQISAAVQRLVGREGIDGLTMACAAEAAGVSVGQLQHYFDGKDMLLEDMFIRYAHRIRRRAGELAEAAVTAKAPIRDVVLEALTDRLPLNEERLRDHRMWLAFMSRASVEPQMAAQYDLVLAGQLALLSQAIHNGKECGEVPESTEPEPAAVHLLALADGLAMQHGGNRRPAEPATAQLLAAVVAQIFPGRCRQWD